MFQNEKKKKKMKKLLGNRGTCEFFVVCSVRRRSVF